MRFSSAHHIAGDPRFPALDGASWTSPTADQVLAFLRWARAGGKLELAVKLLANERPSLAQAVRDALGILSNDGPLTTAPPQQADEQKRSAAGVSRSRGQTANDTSSGDVAPAVRATRPRKLIVPIEPESFYTIEASYAGGGRLGTTAHVLGKDLAKEKRAFRSMADEGERLRFRVVPEGTQPHKLKEFAAPSTGTFLPDSRGVDRLYKREAPSAEQNYVARLRVEAEVARRHSEHFATEAKTLASNSPSQAQKIRKLEEQAKAWADIATGNDALIKSGALSYSELSQRNPEKRISYYCLSDRPFARARRIEGSSMTDDSERPHSSKLELCLNLAGIFVGVVGTAVTLYAATRRSHLVVVSREQLLELARLEGQAANAEKTERPGNRGSFDAYDFKANKR